MRLGIILLVVWGVNILISWGMNRYFGSQRPTTQESVQTGERVAIVAKEIEQPRKLEMDFVDTPRVGVDERAVAKGRDMTYQFSTFGASLDSVEETRLLGGSVGELVVLAPCGPEEREHRALMVAFDEMTPFFYQNMGSKEEAGVRSITYVGESPHVRVTKEFRIPSEGVTVELVLTVEPLKDGGTVHPRLFLPSPHLSDLVGRDVISAVIAGLNKPLEKWSIADATKEVAWALPEIVGVQDKYFVFAMVKDSDAFARRTYFRQEQGNRLTAIVEGPAVKKKTTWHLSLYFGPKEAARLAEVDKRLEKLLEYGWLAPISKALMFLLNFLNRYVHNYGFAIILLTLLIRLVMLPLTSRGEDSMRKQKEFSRKLKLLEQKYADDPERLAQERVVLVKEHGLLPGGCLPLLLQVPIFFALSWALNSSIELYRAPFIWWMKDLSASDPSYILPILAGLSIYLTTGSTTGNDPRQKIAMVIMSLVFAGVALNMSVGLLLFICASSFFGYAQTVLMKKWRRA